MYFLTDETNNLIDIDSRNTKLIKRALEENLGDWLKYHPMRCDINVERTPLSDEEKANLRSLGYAQ